MKKLTHTDLEDLAIGAAILGSGGGGDTEYPYMMAHNVMNEWGAPRLMSISELKPDDVVVPIGLIGAPLAEIENFASGRECGILVELFEKTFKKKVTAIMSYEVGGGTAFTPLTIGPILNLPVLDADTMGRAFPQSQMSSCALLGAECSPGIITDCVGNTTIIYANSPLELEKIARHITIAMGSAGHFIMYPMTGLQAKNMTFNKSISRAISLGKAFREAKQEGKDPLNAILNDCKGVLIGTGKITDIDRVIAKGFLNGSVTIQMNNGQIEVLFQNEFLLAKVNGTPVATTPDILCLLEVDTGVPITSESLQYGLKVNLIALPSPPLWTTPEGLTIAGPRYFGYEMDYIPFSRVSNAFNLTGAYQ